MKHLVKVWYILSGIALSGSIIATLIYFEIAWTAQGAGTLLVCNATLVAIVVAVVFALVHRRDS